MKPLRTRNLLSQTCSVRSESKVEIGSWVPTVDRNRVVMADPEGNEFCVLRTLASQN
ncbi:hypothetical protein [Streptomyces sp. NPDC096132]|uniref:hypothetical protein n=1 Tax=Streptomyces sp. NPDC096132 TaxID=3366075 RepID=UPI0037F15209